MAREDSGVGTGGGQGWQWDVVLSFAGAQRGYVEQVAEALKVRGIRCFYDADEEIDLWGKYLAEELPVIYSERAAAVVVFVSAEYAARDWTRLERRAALVRATRERQEYVLPARFDDTQLPGLLPDAVSVDLRRYTPERFAELVAGKLAILGITVPGLPSKAGDLAGDVIAEPPRGAASLARRWDVALSFAGAQRGYVEQVAEALKVRGIRCFYDADEEIDLWGKYLAEELPVIYSERASAVVVVFVSAEYAARDWTRLERRAALVRATRERQEYVLPARFDDTQLPGLLPDVVSVDLRRYTPEQFAELVAGKLAVLGITVPGQPEITETVSRNVISESIVQKPGRNQVFISYSHADSRWLNELQIHLKPYMRHARIAVWDDSMIGAGTVWKESIRRALASAKVAVLLVSPTFLASKFIAEEELPPLLEASKSEGVTILWVPVRPSSFQVTPIAAYQAVHAPEKPLASLSPAARDKALVKICGIIQQEYLR